MKFKGKVAVWYYLVILAVNLLLIKGIFSPGGNSGDGFFAQMSTLIALLVCNGLMIPIAVRNDVVLEKERLVIHFGFMTQRIPYREITKIKRTHNPLSSMAASLDRIDIRWEHGEVMVAVKEREEFIKELSFRVKR